MESAILQTSFFFFLRDGERERERVIEREREGMGAEGPRKERENIQQILCPAQSPT